MLLEITNEGYKNRTDTKFKRFHWWKAVRHHPKWRARSNDPSTMNAFISSSEATIEEEVAHPIDWDRAKTTAQKRK
jgi:ribosomal protein L32E